MIDQMLERFFCWVGRHLWREFHNNGDGTFEWVCVRCECQKTFPTRDAIKRAGK